MSNPIEDVAFVARSPKRLSILDALADRPSDVRELRDDLDVARTTLNENLTKLESRGWVEWADGEYATTALGESIRVVVHDCLRGVETANELEPLFRHVDARAVEFDLTALHGSELFVAAPPIPYAPVERVRTVVEDSTRVRAVTPIRLPGIDWPPSPDERPVDADLELVVTPSVLDGRSDGGTANDCGPPTDRLFVHERSMRFVLLVAGGTVMFGALDDGVIRVLLVNDSAEAVEWGETLFENCRADATTLAKWYDRAAH